MKGSLKGSQLDISTKAVKRALEIAHANASAAIDQTAEYKDSISAYAQNVRDTMQEDGYEAYTSHAIKAYYARVAELL